jgi:hypothetical protein
MRHGPTFSPAQDSPPPEVINNTASPRPVVIASPTPASPVPAAAQPNDQPEAEGCPLEIAVEQVDKFVDDRLEELGASSRPLLLGMAEINNKATKSGIPLTEQLSSSDLARFNDLRHKQIEIGALKMRFSALERDVKVILFVYQVAKMVDIYELGKERLGEASPLLFYMAVLDALRLAQPRVTLTPITNAGFKCDPEGGLYWEEEFVKREIKKGAVDQRLVNFIFDIERLRTLYQLDWNLFNKALDDLKKVKWIGDEPDIPDTISSYIETSGAVIRDVYKVVTPYINSNLPSDEQVESWFMQKQAEDAAKDFPVTPNAEQIATSSPRSDESRVSRQN